MEEGLLIYFALLRLVKKENNFYGLFNFFLYSWKGHYECIYPMLWYLTMRLLL